VDPPTFWEKAAAKGIPATIIKWPVAFPPKACDANVLAGLGVPDIKGNLGLYSLFTTDSSVTAEGKKGHIIQLEQRGDKLVGQIPGPWTASLTSRKEATVPLEIQRTDDGIICRTGKTVFPLALGAWSEWQGLPFDAGFFRTITGHARFLLQSLTPHINLYVTPVNIPYDSSEMRISTPPSFAGELKSSIGPFATLGLAEDTNALGDEVLSEEEFLQFCNDLVDERERMLFHELGRFREGILACVFDTLDRIQHMFWRFIDQDHPYHDLNAVRLYGSVIDDAYRRMDGIIAKVLKEMPPDTELIICSDHGFSSFRRSVHLNSWLQQAGYLVLKPGFEQIDGLFEGVDWGQTRAYSIGFNSIYLNMKGRESSGIVTADGSRALKKELSGRLLSYTDASTSIFQTIHDGSNIFSGAHAHKAPDLIAGFKPGYRTSWQSAIGALTTGDILENNKNKWSGDHCCDAAAVDGIIFSNSTLPAGLHVQQIATEIESYFS